MDAKAHTLNEMAVSLNRSTVYIAGLQKRFELPVFSGAAYSPAYLAFLRSVTALRSFDVAEETLRELWQVEKKLLQLLHVDTTGSPTWFLDSCGQTTEMKRRLLLTNHDLGVEIHTRMLQPDLNFAVSAPELFAGPEMGEDALRVLGDYLKLHERIATEVQAGRPRLRDALEWSKRVKPGP
jgi:hypothetical protein